MTDWKAHYRNNHTPWDLGGAHPALVNWLTNAGEVRADRRLRALVPGAGRGHDALALARAGFDVTAIDIVDDLHATLGEALEGEGGRFVACDAFAYEAEPADLVFDHTFYCAVPLEDRCRWLQMVNRNLSSGGRLAMIAFPVDKPLEMGGPPWGIGREEMPKLLESTFDPVSQTELPDMNGRRWTEMWVEAIRM